MPSVFPDLQATESATAKADATADSRLGRVSNHGEKGGRMGKPSMNDGLMQI